MISLQLRMKNLIDAFLDMVENHKLVAENSGLLTIAALKTFEMQR